MQGGYYNDKTLVKAMVFGGKEKTYQAWYGIDAYTMATDRTFNWAGAIFNDDGTITGIMITKPITTSKTTTSCTSHTRLSNSLNLNLSGHYTLGQRLL